MKLHIGSIQRRGERFHLVVRTGKKSKWIALKTADRSKAVKRARTVLVSSDDEEAWLRHLVKVGSEAESELRRRNTLSRLSWNTLWDEFILHASKAITPESEQSYGRWMRILENTAAELKLGCGDLLNPESCDRVSILLSQRYISAKRMIVFFRRVYRTLGMNPEIWNTDLCSGRTSCVAKSEFYRRLTVEEVRNVHRSLLSHSPELADMVVIGYSTGLRMSDVSELHIGEVGCGHLNIVPNKTRKKKPHPIRIPLTLQAAEAVMRRIALADQDGYLFPKQFRKRPSRKIAAFFRNCGVLPVMNGRASFHSLRATFISLMDEAGVPPHITDTITGHSGGGMHARYTQPSLQALTDAVNKAIPPL